MLHWMQVALVICASMLLHVPSTHLVHAPAAARPVAALQVPARQFEQRVAEPNPVPVPNVPASQPTQAVIAVAPTTAEYFPATQGVQDAAPKALQVPAAQLVHRVALPPPDPA